MQDLLILKTEVAIKYRNQNIDSTSFDHIRIHVQRFYNLCLKYLFENIVNIIRLKKLLALPFVLLQYYHFLLSITFS